jgi:hypothetical protein
MPNKTESTQMNEAYKRELDKERTPTVSSIFMSSTETKEKALIVNALATDISECFDYEPWHINWITRSSAGVVQAWQPDNTCIYEGSKLNAACRALKLSTYGG